MATDEWLKICDIWVVSDLKPDNKQLGITSLKYNSNYMGEVLNKGIESQRNQNKTYGLLVSGLGASPSIVLSQFIAASNGFIGYWLDQ